MGKFIAKLTGESDGHIVSREFADQSSALAWLQGAGLAEFDDQEARGEIIDANGNLVWVKPHLQTTEGEEKERTRDYTRFRAALNLPINLLKPMKRR